MAEIVIGSLPDRRIMEYTADRVIATHVDFNLKKSKESDDGESFTLHPEPKGIYDPRYFGSIYSKSCNCGRVKKVGVTCELCGSMLMTDEMAFSRFARIDMGIYFSSNLKFKTLIQYLKSTYSYEVEYDPEYPTFDFLEVINAEKGRYKLNYDNALVLAKISWNKETKCLVFSNKIEDPMDCGLDSLVKALQEANDPSWETYLNKLIIVTPARMRPVAIRMEGSQKVLKVPESSTCYSALAYLSDDISYNLSLYYSKGNGISKEDTLKVALKKAAAVYCIRSTESKLTALTAGSKQNIARYTYKIRQPNSGRSVITGDPNLKIDEVGLPTHLAYEAMKTDFINYIKDELRLKRSDAVARYLNPDQQIMDMFKLYAENRVVLINRAPTLHKYNIMSAKVRLVNDNSIHIPILVTPAFNADFDGDTMSFFLVPEEITEYVEGIMSPRNIKVFEKNDSYQFIPKHEVMNGLTLLTKMITPKSDPISIESLETAKEMIDNNELEVYTVIIYKGRKTTYGRELVSNIIQTHLDHVIEPGTKITKDNISDIYAVINKYSPETRVNMIHELQEAALYWVTEYGVTTPTLKDLANAADDDFRPMVNKILDDPKLDKKTKFVKAKELYDSREKIVKKKNPELAEQVSESDRAKVFQLMELSVPQFLTTDTGEIVIPQKPLIEGLNEREYVTHSYNNRALLAIKSMSVPAGGYLTRQLVFVCQNLVINVESDPDNFGIALPRYRCEGRTTTSGEKIGKVLNKDENDLVRVRSVVQSRKGVVSTDMFSDKYGFNTEKSRVGISFASSFTEQLTQSLLALKHGGAMKQIPDDYKLKAPFNCIVVDSDDVKYTLADRNTGEVKTYASSPYIRFVEGNGKKKNEYDKGQLMAELVLPLPPTLKLEMVIKLIGAKSTLAGNRMTRADVTVADSYTMSGGVVHYDFSAGTITIGSESYKLVPDAAYYHAEGDKLAPRTKFRSGIVTPSMLLPANPTPEQIEDVYMVFRDQIYKIVGKDSINEELMEVVFRSCLVDGKFLSVDSAITYSSSVLAAISYGRASKSIVEIIKEPKIINDDPMSNVLLNFMMRDAAHGNGSI